MDTVALTAVVVLSVVVVLLLVGVGHMVLASRQPDPIEERIVAANQ